MPTAGTNPGSGSSSSSPSAPNFTPAPTMTSQINPAYNQPLKQASPKKDFPWVLLAVGAVALLGLLFIVGGGILAYSLGAFGSRDDVAANENINRRPIVTTTPGINSNSSNSNSRIGTGEEKEMVRRAATAVLDACFADDLATAKKYIKTDELSAESFCREAKQNLAGGDYKIWQAVVSQVEQATVGLAEISSKNKSKAEVYLYFDKKNKEFLLYKMEEIKSGSNSNNSNKTAGAHTSSANTISAGVINSKATSLPPPAYPAAAKAVRAGGEVRVQVIVDEDGNVISANAESGHPLLRASAVSAARNAKFTPAIISGKRVKMSGTITYNFVPE